MAHLADRFREMNSIRLAKSIHQILDLGVGPLGAKGALAAGALAAIGASLCCVAPLVLLMLGIGGAWIANLTALSPYSPIFAGLTLLFLGLAFRTLYLAPRPCVVGAACTDSRVVGRQRLAFWVVAIPSLGSLAAPWFAPLFY